MHKGLSTIDILLFRITDILIFNFFYDKKFLREKKRYKSSLDFHIFFRNGMASRKITKVLVLRQFCKFSGTIDSYIRKTTFFFLFYIRSYIVNKFIKREREQFLVLYGFYLTKKSFKFVCLFFQTVWTWLTTESLFTLQQLKRLSSDTIVSL